MLTIFSGVLDQLFWLAAVVEVMIALGTIVLAGIMIRIESRCAARDREIREKMTATGAPTPPVGPDWPMPGAASGATGGAGGVSGGPSNVVASGGPSNVVASGGPSNVSASGGPSNVSAPAPYEPDWPAGRPWPGSASASGSTPSSPSAPPPPPPDAPRVG